MKRASALVFLGAVLGYLAGVLSSVSVQTRADEAAFTKALNQPHEVRVEIASGQARYGQSPDNMWWQSGHENQSVYKHNGTIDAGIGVSINPTWSVNLRYVNFGLAHTRALAITCPNDDCTKRDLTKDTRRAECGQGFAENCLYQWNGDGGDNPGLNFSISARALRLGQLSIEPEIGLFLYRMHWNEQVYPLGCTDNTCPWRVTVEQKTGYYLSPMGGLMARLAITKELSLVAGTRYYLRTSQHVPISAGISGPVQTWLAGVAINF